MSLYGGIDIPGHPDLDNVARLDRLPVPQIRRMERLGWAIDREHFYNLSTEFGAKIVDLEKDIASYIPVDRLHEFASKSSAIEEEQGDATINAGSADQIRKLLFEILGIGSGKPLKTTKGDSSKISTGKKQLELLREDHPVVAKVLEHREYSKLKLTYSDTLPKIARFHPRGEDCPQCGLWHEQETWRVHGEIATTRTDTGRKAHRRPNLGNVPARTENGGRIRLGFIASPGRSGRKKMPGERRTVLLSTDFSQIELRDLAHCAAAKSMIDVYQDNRDIHVFTACAAFGLDETYFSRLLSTDKSLLTHGQKEELNQFKLHNRLPAKNLNFHDRLRGYGDRAAGTAGIVGTVVDGGRRQRFHRSLVQSIPGSPRLYGSAILPGKTLRHGLGHLWAHSAYSGSALVS